MEFDLRRALLLKDEQIRELECSLAEKEAQIEELRASLDKYQVSCVFSTRYCRFSCCAPDAFAVLEA